MRIFLVKVNVCVNKTSGVVGWGLGWKKLGSSWDQVYSIPILYHLQILRDSVKQDVVFFF